MILRARAFLAALLSVWLAAAASAQLSPPASDDAPVSTLIADRVEITADGRLVASGNVEAMQGDLRLKAARITFDQSTDQLEIEGPIVLRQGTETVLVAESAELSTDLRDGLMRSARVVMQQQMQLAAVEDNRVGGRYTQLYNTVASSCQVCAARPTPLWQIRAKRVVHDDLEKQLYFDNATFEIAGVPVMYLPQLRLPDPTVERATGFLTPSLRTTDELGFGIKVPYFVTLGPSRDVTFTPYVAVSRTATMELRYRQAFRNGELEVNSAASVDSIHDGPRAYLFANGEFDLPRNIDLQFDVEMASDDTYMLQYDYSDKDRLASSLSLTQVDRQRLAVAEIIAYRSLRPNESNKTQPFLVNDAIWVERLDPAWLPGELFTSLDYHAHYRESQEDVVGLDVQRLAGWFDWQVDGIGPAGLVMNAAALGRFEYSQIENDTNFPSTVTQFTPYGVAEIRWPWVRQGAQAGHVIEPVVQVVYTPDAPEVTPRDESTQLEFDEGNLVSLSRFPAGDVLERGLRANVGLAWTRYAPSGWSMGITAGRIYRQEDLGQFAGYEIFEGTLSDWVTTVHFTLPPYLKLTNRAVYDSAYNTNRNEIRLDWTSERYELGTTYIWMVPSPVEDRPDYTSEWTVDGELALGRRWETEIDWRYDFVLDRTARAQFGLSYLTDCATFNFSVRRLYSSSDQSSPTTDFNFEVQLAGFGDFGGGSRPPSRACFG